MNQPGIETALHFMLLHPGQREILENKMMTEEELTCEKHFRSTYSRAADGRYQVEPPLIEEDPIEIGNSKHIAITRLFGMEKQFCKNQQFQEDHIKCINEYNNINHIQKVGSIDLGNENQKIISNYLPYHDVIKKSSSTTKLRVVFDASRPTFNGSSLNNKMMEGALIKTTWPLFCSDFKSKSNLHLTTPIIGEYFATRVLKQLTTDERIRYPSASQATLESFYIDDLLSGADSLEEALQFQKQLINMMASSGFSLRTWSSNAAPFLKAVPKEHREIE
ncbi:uncharacterized protein LOC129616536 [Condylostylus longicornis]|uniref:uncharacterized protein LOC129616536 n=1 Tax=Condylostylus longicornis TaxID=2530218 RepID=UPI00244DA053|nr:uncharacterized protein LOC129616536 [Condylostylus longicornis]